MNANPERNIEHFKTLSSQKCLRWKFILYQHMISLLTLLKMDLYLRMLMVISKIKIRSITQISIRNKITDGNRIHIFKKLFKNKI